MEDSRSWSLPLVVDTRCDLLPNAPSFGEMEAVPCIGSMCSWTRLGYGASAAPPRALGSSPAVRGQGGASCFAYGGGRDGSVVLGVLSGHGMEVCAPLANSLVRFSWFIGEQFLSNVHV